MRLNQTKQKLLAGKPVFGVISGVSDPKIGEMLGLAGFDYYMMDGEHGAITPALATNLVRGCETANITPLARIGQPDKKLILQYLDAGIAGVMMPGLETVEQIEMLVEAVKYPPLGKRGVGLSRASDYMMGRMSQAEYVTFANEQTLVIPQFEDVALLDKLPAMAAVPGVDGFVIGPRDLSMSMGFYDSPNHPQVQDVIDQAIEIIQAAGLWAGITAGTGEAAQRQLDRGAQLILNSLPNLVARSSEQFLRPFAGNP